MRQLVAVVLALLWADTAAVAEAAPVVVELYTSQGCSSCPPADEMLEELAGHAGVIALALHVDYWDYIGWTDTFGSPQFTARQRAYARAAGATTIYTPQFIIGGESHVVGARAMEVMEQIQAHAARDGLALQATLSGGQAHLTVQPPARSLAPPKGFVIQLVRYLPEVDVDVLAGENAGKRLVYAHIVTSWQRIAEWDGAAPLDIRFALEGGQPAVVIVQAAGPGRIFAAAELRP